MVFCFVQHFFVRALYEFVLLLVEFQLVYKRLGPDSSSVMTGFVLVSFSGRVLVVQEQR
jgi:hypothetical protein